MGTYRLIFGSRKGQISSEGSIGCEAIEGVKVTNLSKSESKNNNIECKLQKIQMQRETTCFCEAIALEVLAIPIL